MLPGDNDNDKDVVVDDNVDDDSIIFNDPIHGYIKLPSLCVKIIDTPQFQRLRFIKQLGLCCYVFPGACHTRFEHSIGTCHLAEKLTKNLQKRHPELKITKKDLLCVIISGLCHDLGHGPFSHTFDKEFMPRVLEGESSRWKHEDASIRMFDYLYDDNEEVRKGFETERLTEQDRNFIKNLMKPSEELKHNVAKTGRGKSKGFLYEILSNEENGIDVDKWDYLARDCFYLGINNLFDHRRLIEEARVIELFDEQTRISYRDREIENVYEMFHLRRKLYRIAYQHKTVNNISEMVVKALLLADKSLTRTGFDGKQWSLSASTRDMKAFSQFTDSVFEEILYSTSEKLEEPRTILNKIHRRELYTFVGEFLLPLDFENTSIHQICNAIKEEDQTLKDKFIFHATVLNYGSGFGNPVEKVPFYSKPPPSYSSLSSFPSPENISFLSSDQVSLMLPKIFCETFLQIFLEDSSLAEKAKKLVQVWIKKKLEKKKHILFKNNIHLRKSIFFSKKNILFTICILFFQKNMLLTV